MTAYALAHERIRVGTGVVPIYTRTPATMAQTAATIDELSGGRLNLGLGVSHRPVVEGWHGQTIDRPVAEMREYVGDRARDPARRGPAGGREVADGLPLAGLDPRPELPIYIAALSPAMLRLAGEIADGVMLWLCNPQLHPRRRGPGGARRVASAPARRSTASTSCRRARRALTDDPDVAYAAMRRELIPYFCLPFYRAMIERSGFGEDIAALRRAAGAATARDAARDLRRFPRRADGGRRRATTSAPGSSATARRAPPRRASGPIPKTDFEATLEAAISAPNPAATRGDSSCDSITRSIRPYSRACSAREEAVAFHVVVDSARRGWPVCWA